MHLKSLFVVLIFFLAISITGCSDTFTEEFPDKAKASAAFQDEFGMNVPPEISEIRGKVLQNGDTFARWLEFSYVKTAIDKILADGWATANSEALNSGSVWSEALKSKNINAPTWWPKDPISDGVMIYYKEQRLEGGQRRYAYMLIYDHMGKVYSKGCIWQ